MKRGKQGDGGGRPMIVFDEAQIAQVEALAAVMSKRQLCDYMSVGETTFREIEGRQPELFNRPVTATLQQLSSISRRKPGGARQSRSKVIRTSRSKS
jgi:hypothetical protein